MWRCGQAENSVLKCKVDEYRAQARHLEELHAVSTILVVYML
jgi:hypothetical protein